MSIDFSCSCGQQYRVKEEFAGRTTTCKKCGSKVTVPKPALDPMGDLGSLLDEELGPAGSSPSVAAEDSATPLCPACDAKLPKGGRLCLQCGFDTTTGKLLETAGAATVAAHNTDSLWSGPLRLLLGTGISGMGAILGGLVWAAVALMTGFQFGWIAIAVGAAAGGGMAAAFAGQGGGPIAGAISAGMALVGVVLGKIFIVVWLLMPLLTGDLGAFSFKREFLAATIADEAMQERGVALDDPEYDRAYEAHYQDALRALEEVDDEEIDRRMLEVTEEMRREAELAVQQPPPADGNDEVDEQDPPERLTAHVEDFEPQAEEASALGLLFSSLFHPLELLFVLLAMGTAFKLGSGYAGS